MIYGTLVFIYCVKEHGNRTPKHPMLLPLLLLAAAAVSALSVYPPRPPPLAAAPLSVTSASRISPRSYSTDAHHICYTLMVIWLISSSVRLYRCHTTDPTSAFLIKLAVGTYVAGVPCWLLDYYACDKFHVRPVVIT
jgi:hypothetical protein